MLKRELTANDVEWTVTAEYEDEQIEGSFEDCDGETAKQIREALEGGNEWAWCCAKVTGRFMHLESTDYLGCCSYSSEEEFRGDAYFEDMQNSVLAELNKELTEFVATLQEKGLT